MIVDLGQREAFKLLHYLAKLKLPRTTTVRLRLLVIGSEGVFEGLDVFPFVVGHATQCGGWVVDHRQVGFVLAISGRLVVLMGLPLLVLFVLRAIVVLSEGLQVLKKLLANSVVWLGADNTTARVNMLMVMII